MEKQAAGQRHGFVYGTCRIDSVVFLFSIIHLYATNSFVDAGISTLYNKAEWKILYFDINSKYRRTRVPNGACTGTEDYGMLRFIFQKNIERVAPDIAEILTEFNLKRVTVTAIIVMLFPIISIVDTHFFDSFLYSVGSVLIEVLSVLYLILINLVCRRLRVRNRTAWQSMGRILSFSFWLLLCLGMIPFFAGDILTGRFPINLTLFCCALAAIPIFTTRQALGIYLFFLVSGIVIGIFCHAEPFFYCLVVFLGLAGFFLSRLVQSQFVPLILQLKRESGTDYLTGILNRQGGLEKMNTILEVCKRHHQILAVLMVDIDYFKKYNDQFGHLQGDRALQAIARCMTSCFSRSSDMVCRYGGEEFVICFTAESNEELLAAAERLRNAVFTLQIPSASLESSPVVSISIGATAFLPGNDPLKIDDQTLIKRSDRALYQAKKEGRNRIAFYHPSFSPDDNRQG